jgi:hypothetical protein
MNEKNEWRLKLKVGDLVMMKHGGMALITMVHSHNKLIINKDFTGEYAYPPHIKMIYCDDGELGSCSSYRVERLMNESR